MNNKSPPECKEAHHLLIVLGWINEVLDDADPGYLRLHHKMMQANWHQYIECTGMRVGMRNNT